MRLGLGLGFGLGLGLGAGEGREEIDLGADREGQAGEDLATEEEEEEENDEKGTWRREYDCDDWVNFSPRATTKGGWGRTNF